MNTLNIAYGEVLRYLGMGGAVPDETLEKQIQRARAELSALVQVRFVFERFELQPAQDDMGLKNTVLHLTGEAIQKHLEGCTHAVLMAVTLGMNVQKAIAARQATSVTEALCLDACATAAVEEACDLCEAEINSAYPGARMTSRFSPGYGDLPLSLQDGILTVLNARRRIGLFLTESGLLTPCKSVTAIVGIGNDAKSIKKSCVNCSRNGNCALKRGGACEYSSKTEG